MVRADSSCAVALEIPFSVRDFDVCNISRIERDVGETPNLADDRTARNGNVLDDTAVAQRDGNDLVVHAGLRLREQEFAPFFRQRDLHI
jgi:hypothetical protein